MIDDALAFSGGLDLTTRRWDTREHRLDDPRRVDLAGVPYPPFHDVQAMVDGKAAAALAELARMRWTHGACERAPPIRPTGDPWPQSVTPDLTDIDVGIARTSPALDDESEIREVEALFFDMVDRAERCIYIENQYLTSQRFAERLAQPDDRAAASSRSCWSRRSTPTPGSKSRPCRPASAASCRCSRTRA